MDPAVEIEEMWAELLVDAAKRAESSGRSDIAEYVRLRAANDAVRRIGVDWLISASTARAFDYQIRFPNVSIDRIDAHRFAFANSTMLGTAIEIRHGVRCLSVEAGWARRPADGIMTGGALAHGRISHFGYPQLTTDLSLIDLTARSLDAAEHAVGPIWIDENKHRFSLDNITDHLDRLLAD